MTSLAAGLSDLDTLRCPACRAVRMAAAEAGGIVCGACGAVYPHDPKLGVARLLAPDALADSKADIPEWWGDLYQQLYAENDAALTADTLTRQLQQLEDMFVIRQHLAATEMPLSALAGLRVLEIGPGAGGHSAMFAQHGAEVTAIDITPERAAATARKLRIIGKPPRAYQADAENLPFSDDSFDIVYSNGVLHHSENTEQCIAEVLRVLKPGGRAVIMLYARHSAVFWLNIVPRGIVSGEIFRWPEAVWVGRVTEGKPKYGDVKNPFTRVYSAARVRALFHGFRQVSLRKSSFQFDNFAVPRLTQIRAAVMRLLGREAHPGGMLVYGAPFMAETRLELWLGKYIGFSWNIVATKPSEDSKEMKA